MLCGLVLQYCAYIFKGIRSLTAHADQQVQVNLLVGFQWAKHFLAYTCSELG